MVIRVTVAMKKIVIFLFECDVLSVRSAYDLRLCRLKLPKE